MRLKAKSRLICQEGTFRRFNVLTVPFSWVAAVGFFGSIVVELVQLSCIQSAQGRALVYRTQLGRLSATPVLL